MDFWNTVLGNQLANILCHTLPQLVEKKTQVVESVHRCEIENAIDYYLKDDYRLVDHIDGEKDKVILVFEK